MPEKKPGELAGENSFRSFFSMTISVDQSYGNPFPGKTISAVEVSHSTPSHQNWIDLPINDEDTRHSLGSFMSDITPTTPHQPVPLHSSTQITASTPTDAGPFRAITTPTSEICKSELLEQNLVQDTLNSQSMPANPNSAFIQWSAHVRHKIYVAYAYVIKSMKKFS